MRRSIKLDLELIDTYDPLLRQLESELVRSAKSHDPHSFSLLKTIPGIGRILGMTLLCEIHDIRRPSAEGINQDGKHDKPFTRFCASAPHLRKNWVMSVILRS